jgi:transcriptional regulator with XRE-family HTH domain
LRKRGIVPHSKIAWRRTRERIDYGQRLQEARRALGLTESEIAARLGLSVGAISSWETGRTAPSEERLAVVGEAYGIAIDQLLPLPNRRDNSPGRLEIAGTRLMTVRESRGYSQAMLAEEAGLSASVISSWEKEETRPHWREWARVCAILGRDATSREDVIASHRDLREINQSVARMSELRRASGLSQPRFAELIEVDASMISKLENGHRAPSVALKHRIWKILTSQRNRTTS